jgi:nitrite reductase (NADH) small subunit
LVHDVGPLDALPNDAFRIMKLGSQEVGIIRRGDRVFAIRNACPHQNAPICAGIVEAGLGSRGVGSVTREAGSVLACPWHGWEFDVRTGRAIWDRSYRVRTYPTHVEKGRVLVELRRPGSGGDT